MDWFKDTFNQVLQKKMEKDPEFKKEVDKILDEEKQDRFESIKKQICKEILEEAYFEQHHSKVQNMINALERLADNIQNTHYFHHSESSKSHLLVLNCQKLRLQYLVLSCFLNRTNTKIL